MTHRRDIDGLRALAIVPVVLFHAGTPGFGGGFVGVDVFFMISGFLITSLITQEMAHGQFSIVAFYERRIRRIFPALFVVVLTTAVASALILLPDDLDGCASSVIATALFASNFLFWSQIGYFDAPIGKPLLHTWSIAIEEQFYVVFPIVLVLLRRYGRRTWSIAIACIAVASFAVCTLSQESAAFYSPLSRAWELMLGALLAVGAVPRISSALLRSILAWLGLVMIASSVVMFSATTRFPGVNALLPCTGALLLLGTGAEGTRVSGLLGWRPIAFVGQISYSWYLWHWPLWVLLRHLLAREPSGVEIAGFFVGSLVLAALSWHFIERPFRVRVGSRRSRIRAFASAGVVIALSVAVGLVLPRLGTHRDLATTHIRGREDYRAGTCFLDEQQSYADWPGAPACVIDNHAKRTVLVWGDSFAAHYTPGLAADTAFNYVLYSAYSCPPVIGARVPWARQCHDIDAHIVDVLDRFHVDTAVLAARWERYWNRSVTRDQLQATISMLAARRLRVVVVEQGPSFEFLDPLEYVTRTGREAARSIDHSSINAELSTLIGVDAFFDPHRVLCSGGDCAIVQDGRFLYADPGHYSVDGSLAASRGLVELLCTGGTCAR